MLKLKLLLCLILLSPSLLLSQDPQPYCKDDACFPKTVAPFGTMLNRVSKARYRYYGFLVFDSSLYLPTPQDLNEDFLGIKPCALRLCYHRTMSADDFRRSGSETLALNPSIKLNELAPKIKLLHDKYQEVHEGDCYQLSFRPGIGTELSLNDRPIITIPGDEFAAAYLGIWLSRYSFSESLTEKLTTPITD